MDSRNTRFVGLVLASACLALLPTGCKQAPPITLTAVATPPAVYPGDAVSVTATAGSVDPNKKTNVVYNWSGTGVTGSGSTASVATAALKPGQSADATASFTVKQFEPPTISCSVSPTVLKPGESATVTAVGVSPQNRSLTYSFTASAGSISGSGNTATFSSVGAPTGPVSFTCTVTDDVGQSATATISAANGLTITAPYVPPTPHVQTLAPISFESDKKNPARVNNESKADLDEVAIDLQKQPDAKLVLVGDSDAKEKTKCAKEMKAAKKNKHLKVVDPAAERAVNTKAYLVNEKGIDASRISVATGTSDGKKVEVYLVPAGADFAADVPGTTPVDETAVKPQVRKPLAAKHAHKKAAAK